MKLKDILDLIWKYLMLLLAVWALVLLTGHLCLTRCVGDSHGIFNYGGLKGLCGLDSDNISVNVEYLEEGGDSLIVIKINGEELLGEGVLGAAAGKFVIDTDEIEGLVSLENGKITLEITIDDDDDHGKKVVRKVIKTTGE